MRQILEALDRMRNAGATGHSGRLAVPLDPDIELRPLIAYLQEAQQTRPLEGGARPSGIDIDALCERWQRSGTSIVGFIRRELRAMCWDVRLAGDPHFLHRLETEGIVPSRMPFLRGIWHAYQSHWPVINAPQIGRLLREGRRSRSNVPRWLKQVCDTPGILDDNATQALATLLLADLPSSRNTLRLLALTPEGKLGAEGLKIARQQWLQLISSDPNGSYVPAVFASGCEGLLAPDLIDAAGLREACERLLLLVAHGSNVYREALRHFITTDERLGHPRRTATRGNWAGFSQEAMAAAVRLFAARDLGTFFDILIGKYGDTQMRRSFWEQYIESPQLVDFAIACDEGDHARLKAHWRDGKPTVARLEGAPWQYSAFVMRFRVYPEDIVIAEMSKANNAMYQFTISVFEDQVGPLEQNRMSFLRLKNRQVASDWHTHRGDWHYRFASHLRRLGIQPG